MAASEGMLCKIILLQQMLFLCQLDNMEISDCHKGDVDMSTLIFCAYLQI